MKIGIYAGTFDPIHNGHINFAKNAVKFTALDKVVIVAEKNPYRKKPHATWDHRQAMIERATENIVEADHDYEFSNKLSHQFTMQNMLQGARDHYGVDHEFWFLVGSDIFEHIQRWQNIVKEHEYGGFIVALRDNHTQAWLNDKIAYLRLSGFNINVQLIVNHKPHISSRLIREQLLGHNLPNELSPRVYEYMLQHSLYDIEDAYDILK